MGRHQPHVNIATSLKKIIFDDLNNNINTKQLYSFQKYCPWQDGRNETAQEQRFLKLFRKFVFSCFVYVCLCDCGSIWWKRVSGLPHRVYTENQLRCILQMSNILYIVVRQFSILHSTFNIFLIGLVFLLATHKV